MNLFLQIEKFLTEAEKPLLISLGPTASGKTKLSLKIAQKFQGEIISTDSRQIYTEMDISTDALAENEQENVPHHMLGIRQPDQILTMAEYKDLAFEIIEKIHQKKHLPMLVGGTGLYSAAISEGYQVPRIPPNPEIRQKLEQQAKEHGSQHLHDQLSQLDPQAAANIHPNNLRYLIRALEINLVTGQNKKDQKQSQSPFDIMMIGIQWPREELYKRINDRVDLQVQRGLVQEVEKLLAKGYSEDLPSMSSLGVKEIIPYIKGQMSLEECIEILKRNTRRYAKRQLSWFRRYPDINWITAQEVQQLTN